MTQSLGDFPVDAAVTFLFTTHAATGAAVAPLSAFEIADVRIYKNSSATQRTSSSGMTMTSPFDSVTGLHCVEIDLTDNTDAGFFAVGNQYHVVLVPDTATVDGQTVVSVLATFGITVNSATILADAVNTKLGTPPNLGSGATFGDNSTDIWNTADSVDGTLGASGSGLTAIPWNAAWDAEVQSEANDALVANGLDHLVAASVTGTDIIDNSIIAKIVSKSATADWDSYNNTTDALEAQRDNIGVAGAGLTAIGDTRLANLDATVSSRLATAGYTAPLDAAGTRTAVGLAAANLDTQLAALPTDQDVRDAMKLAPTAGAPAAGSVDKHLDDILEDTAALGSATITVVSAIVGSTITFTRGDTFSVAIAGMGDITSYANVWFTVKWATSDADSAAIVQIDTDTGLLTVNGATATAGDGSIAVDDDSAGDITITLNASVTDDLTPATGLVYDVQWQTAAGAIHTLTSGAAVVAADVTRAVA